jgi:hypothetical protein
VLTLVVVILGPPAGALAGSIVKRKVSALGVGAATVLLFLFSIVLSRVLG